MTDLTALAEQLDNAKIEEISSLLIPVDFDSKQYDSELQSVQDHWKGVDDVIYIDIETIPGERPPSIDEMKVPKNLKKEESINAYRTNPDNINAQWHKEALISHQGRVLCIGIAINDSDPVLIIHQEEEQMFLKFDEILEGHQRVIWVGQNIQKFDMLWIWQRAIKYSCINIIKAIRPDRYRGNIRDLMQIMGGVFSNQYMIGLDAQAKYLELQSSKQGIDGSLVFKFWKEGKYDAIFKYCKDDVVLNRDIYKMASFAVNQMYL